MFFKIKYRYVQAHFSSCFADLFLNFLFSQYVPPDLCICNFVLEQSLSVRALQEMLANTGDNASDGVSKLTSKNITFLNMDCCSHFFLIAGVFHERGLMSQQILNFSCFSGALLLNYCNHIDFSLALRGKCNQSFEIFTKARNIIFRDHLLLSVQT